MKSMPEFDRRSLLKLCGGAALALGLPARLALASVPERAPVLVLVDQRYRESELFAESLAGAGVEFLTIGRDLARLWSNGIAPHLVSKPLAVRGLTLPADLFGLERLAEGSGAATVARVDIALCHPPRRGSPRSFVCWAMHWSGEAQAPTG